MDHRKRRELAKTASDVIRKTLEVNEVRTGIVLGTGWGKSLVLANSRAMPFKMFSGFKGLGKLEGHDRLLVIGELEGRTVALLCGRVHVNELPGSNPAIFQMVNLQVEMLFQLGITSLVLTCAAGSLRDNLVLPGHRVLVRDYFGLFFPNTLAVGEFVPVEDAIDMRWISRVRERRPELHLGSHAAVTGTTFESPSEKAFLMQHTPCLTVGMSMLPETRAAASHNTFSGAQHVAVLPIAGISNTATEHHDHETNVARMDAQADELGALLTEIVHLSP